ncbi:probable inactive receptor kinase RLK902 [Tanacetum coccineum]|uniref:Probable inactive receptor kinase RLK902 n=1 Tax=Tanacetum coccineum TaxID=301880 RepID=A0ABQ4ZD32_9ASTR
MLAIEGARTSLLGLYVAIFMLIALEIKFELASLMREHDDEKIRVQLEENVIEEGPEPMEIDSKSSSSLIPNFGVTVLEGHASSTCNRGVGRTPLNWERRSPIALGAARGITYLHAQGSTVSHENIKSSNILLTTSYKVRVDL